MAFTSAVPGTAQEKLPSTKFDNMENRTQPMASGKFQMAGFSVGSVSRDDGWAVVRLRHNR